MPSEPWHRQKVNEEFLRHEVALIEQAKPWYRRFRDSAGPAAMAEATFYTVRADLDAGWRAAVHQHGHEVGLSTLYNQNAIRLIALVPSDVRRPPVGRLIRVEASRRVTLVHPKSKTVEHFLVVQEWSELSPIQPYLDLEMQPAELPRLVAENLATLNDYEASALVQPVMSSPPTGVRPGGLHFAGDAGDMRLSRVRTALSTLQGLAPPEFRPGRAPGKLYQGFLDEIVPGIKVLLAERAPKASHVVESQVGDPLGALAAFRAGTRAQERTIYAGIQQKGTNQRAAAYAPYLSIVHADFALAEPLDQLFDVDVEFESLRRATDERAHAAVAASHQYMPDFQEYGPFLGAAMDRYREVADTLLAAHFQRDSERERMVRLLCRGKSLSLARAASSFTRGRGTDQMTRDDFTAAFRSAARALEGFENTNKSLLSKFGRGTRSRVDDRYKAVHLVLSVGPIQIEDLWEDLSADPAFKGDRVAFEETLRIMQARGQIVQNRSGIATLV